MPHPTTAATATTASTATSAVPQHRSRAVGATTAVGAAIAAGVLAVLGVAVALGTSVAEDRWQEQRTYAAAADVPPHNGVFALPGWTPAGATDIAFDVQTQGGGRTITLTASAPLSSTAGCAPAEAPAADPVPEPDWPDGVREAAGVRCGDWYVVTRGARVWAWDAFHPRSERGLLGHLGA